MKQDVKLGIRNLKVTRGRFVPVTSDKNSGLTSSTNVSNFTSLVLPRRYAPGIMRLTLQTSLHSFSAWLGRRVH